MPLPLVVDQVELGVAVVRHPDRSRGDARGAADRNKREAQILVVARTIFKGLDRAFRFALGELDLPADVVEDRLDTLPGVVRVGAERAAQLPNPAVAAVDMGRAPCKVGFHIARYLPLLRDLVDFGIGRWALDAAGHLVGQHGACFLPSWQRADVDHQLRHRLLLHALIDPRLACHVFFRDHDGLFGPIDRYGDRGHDPLAGSAHGLDGHPPSPALNSSLPQFGAFLVALPKLGASGCAR